MPASRHLTEQGMHDEQERRRDETRESDDGSVRPICGKRLFLAGVEVGVSMRRPDHRRVGDLGTFVPLFRYMATGH